MRQVRRRSRLAQKALAHVGAPGKVGRKRLDGDWTVELEVAGEVDDPHATTPDLTLDVVLASECGGER
jgi:hypothetical protein